MYWFDPLSKKRLIVLLLCINRLPIESNILKSINLFFLAFLFRKFVRDLSMIFDLLVYQPQYDYKHLCHISPRFGITTIPVTVARYEFALCYSALCISGMSPKHFDSHERKQHGALGESLILCINKYIRRTWTRYVVWS